MPTLNWIGKEKVTNHHLDIPYHTLDLQYQYGLNQDLGDVTDATDLNNGNLANPQNPKNQRSDNLIIHADNLLALKSLLPQYEGRIQCIYIDPPYNTGNEGWVYNDNVSSPRFKKWLGQVVGKEGEDLTRHDKWLCMMYPRLKLLHKLLAEDGAIFISIDDNEQANLKMTMDEIFGERNFIGDVIWKCRAGGGGDSKFFSNDHEYVLCYSKSINLLNRFFTDYTEEQLKKFQYEDENGRYFIKTLEMPEALGKRPNLQYPIEAPDGTIIENKREGINYTWVLSQLEFLKYKNNNLVEFKKINGKWMVYRKYHIENPDGGIRQTKPRSILDKIALTSNGSKEIKSIFGANNEKKIFDNPKPMDLIKYFIAIVSNKDSIILDSFAGSGTTAHAVLNLNKQDGGNRKFILIEMEDYAETITAERVKRVINGYGNTEGTGGNFNYYTLGERVLDDDHHLNTNLALPKIHAYIWHTETHQAYTQQATEAGYLGKYQGSGIYFHYQPYQVTVLNDAYLVNVIEPCEQYIMYADMCLLSEKLMAKHNIIFKKIPRDISKL